MKKVTKIILIFFTFLTFLFFTQKVAAYDCVNRNPGCPRDTYPNCRIVGQCTTPPNCLVGFVSGVEWPDPYIICAEPISTPNPTLTPAVTNTPAPTANCPVCPNSFHWHYGYGLCCKNNETPECRTSLQATRENCAAGQTCIPGRGCTASPTSTPHLIPTLSQNNPAINFNDLGDAIPGLTEPFKPGAATNVGSIISLILPYLYVIAGLMLLFYLLLGGFHMMTAGSDEKGLVEAKGKITNALIGFLLLFVSYWLVKILGVILGMQIF